MNIPRVVIGGIRSGEGKTTISLGLMAALHTRGLTVQGFKVGPDYLDTGYQLLATGQVGRNLDLWMMGETVVRRNVTMQGGRSDIAIIEGVMGLFDGHRDGVTPTSTADVARTLGAPVILVIDASHLAASAGALALGYRLFDPNIQVVGAIFNRWNPSRSKVAVERAMAKAGVSVLGYLPPTPEIALPSRHLGLVVAEEMRDEVDRVLTQLVDLLNQHIDIERVIAIANSAPPLAMMPSLHQPVDGSGLRIGVAYDEAFAFYYPENIELLEQAGVEVVYFSPLHDAHLPSVNGLYLGGGYPELHARRLSENRPMKEAIAIAIADGLPTYAECGGLLYLCTSLTDIEERCWPMAGVVPRCAKMHSRLQRMGYREGKLRQNCLMGSAGERIRGHEFHYSSCEPEIEENSIYLLDGRAEGYGIANLVASYQHVHFAGYPAVVTHWIKQCRQYQKEQHLT